MVVGMLLAAFALVRGKIKERYGGGWSALWTPGAYEQESRGSGTSH